jgi:radical SAM enzyme (TIGR01210 family)
VRLPLTGRLLSTVGRKAREARSPFEAPESYFNQVSADYAEVWFPSPGCMWDGLGHCTTCNYGAPREVDDDDMVRAVELALDGIAPSTETLWVSAFDTLQHREVPTEVRRRIFALLGSSPAKTILTETHPASIREEVVVECVELLNGRTLALQLGVETMDEFVRFACVNKPFTNVRLARAVEEIRASGAEAWANLIVGIPFLGRAEVVEGTARSVAQALDLGFEAVVLFPNHVKEHTVAHTLATAGRYQPPDLWVIRDVLRETHPELLPRVHLAWLDLKPHPGAPDVVNAPDQSATQRLRGYLDEFNMGRDIGALDTAFLLERPSLARAERPRNLTERLVTEYGWLASTYGEAGWWADNADGVRAELAAAVTDSGPEAA